MAKNTPNAEVPEKFDDALVELRGLMELLESDDITVDTLTQAIRRACDIVEALPIPTQRHRIRDQGIDGRIGRRRQF
jgi:hypothetical protein